MKITRKRKGPSGLITTRVDCSFAGCIEEAEQWKKGAFATNLAGLEVALCKKHANFSWSEIPSLKLNTIVRDAK